MEPIEDKKAGVEVKKDFAGLFTSVKQFMRELLDIRENTDQEATIASINADIPFKGHTSWILICSIFIASIGLNANSTAVVIGAMLISPLMGPILGMGMSLAINDIDTLRRSVNNFVVMVVLSVLTAFLFFKFFPLRDESSELLARTAPDIRDVLIAFFGGLSLVIARTKKGTIASVIFGVAIATALMPPLCTVGFGLAIGNWSYAGGAMYLFLINTIFIGLATFLVLKVLRFPMVRYANSQRRKRIAQFASLLAVLAMIPAGWTFYNVFQESRFKNDSRDFIGKSVAVYQFQKRGRFLDNLTKIDYNKDKGSLIELVCMGDELIPASVIDTWRVQKNNYPALKNAELRIIQGGKDDSEEKYNFVNELYESKKAELLTKSERIRVLEEEITVLSRLTKQQIPFEEVSAEAKINYEGLESLSFAYVLNTDFSKIDTIPTFSLKWNEGLKVEELEKKKENLTKWLKLRLGNDKIIVN